MAGELLGQGWQSGAFEPNVSGPRPSSETSEAGQEDPVLILLGQESSADR